jgi:hypothetical protein
MLQSVLCQVKDEYRSVDTHLRRLVRKVCYCPPLHFVPIDAERKHHQSGTVLVGDSRERFRQSVTLALVICVCSCRADMCDEVQCPENSVCLERSGRCDCNEGYVVVYGATDECVPDHLCTKATVCGVLLHWVCVVRLTSQRPISAATLVAAIAKLTTTCTPTGHV